MANFDFGQVTAFSLALKTAARNYL